MSTNYMHIQTMKMERQEQKDMGLLIRDGGHISQN